MDEFSALQSSVQSSLVSTTRAASTISNEDLPFHRSLSSSLAATLDQQNARLLDLASGLLATATATEETVRRSPSLKDLDGIDGNWRALVDVVDSLLERADTALDEFTGAVKRLSPGLADKGTPKVPPKISKIAAQLRAQDMAKPQVRFEHAPTNQESGPFKPLLLNKPHALVPLETTPILTDELSQPQYDHPYQLEIEQYRYPASVYTQADPIPYHAFDSTTATFVDTEEALDEMLQELKRAKEIAIDLEHHDQRSYVGIVSLMQISTRDSDWIIDTLKPWRRKLQCLNQVFADPSILKVLHGAYMDIVWLQRDLGLYIVGLFDTHYAARALGYPGGSLAFLLKKFVNFDAQKQYQTADWRIRPLPQELFDYARSDTHYLLYIYDCMRNELIERSDFSVPNQEGDKLSDVLHKSNETALQRYEHPVYDPEFGQGPVGWYKLLSRTSILFTKEQFAVFKAIHQWRDNVARKQDDSVHYVMPNHQLFSLARETPTNRAAVLGIAQPTTQTVRLRVDELVAVIARAKDEGQNGMEMLDVLQRFEPQRASNGAARVVEPSHAVTSFLPSGTVVANGASSINAPRLRSTTSAFWGGAFESSAHDQKRPVSGSSGLSLTMSMPALTAEIFADAAEVESYTPGRSPPVQASGSQPPVQRAQKEQNNFVIEERSRKRKRRFLDSNEPGLEEAEQADELSRTNIPIDEQVSQVANGTSSRISGNVGIRDDASARQAEETLQNDTSRALDEQANRAKDKLAKRMARKEAKRAAKLSRESNAEDGMEPFDYTSAPSIVNPQREDPRLVPNGRMKQVDPYRKSLDTPKGLPRVQKERAGKSMTFQS